MSDKVPFAPGFDWVEGNLAELTEQGLFESTFAEPSDDPMLALYYVRDMLIGRNGQRGDRLERVAMVRKVREEDGHVYWAVHAQSTRGGLIRRNDHVLAPGFAEPDSDVN